MARNQGKVRENVRKLIDQRDRLLVEAEALRNKIAGLELAISLIEQDSAPSTPAEPQRRGNVKELLIDLLREVGTIGLNANSAVEMAARRGMILARGTAASNLSRMKADGVVTHNDDRYRLPEFSRPKKPSPEMETAASPELAPMLQ